MEAFNNDIEVSIDTVATMKWKVYKFLTLFRNRRGIKSKSFLLDNQHYYFRISVNAQKYLEVPLFKVHLETDGQIRDEIYFKIGIEKTDGSVYISQNAVFFCKMHEDERVYSHRSDVFAPKDIIKDRIMTVICTAHRKQDSKRNFKLISTNPLLDAASQTISLESVETLSENLKELLSSSCHADVKFKVGNKEFQAHKSIVAARSPVLYSMFSSEILDNNTGVFIITDVDEDAFEAFLVFLYSGKFIQIPSSKFKVLYEVAEKYDLHELKRECVKRFVIKMSVDLVCDALIVSILYDEKSLFEIAAKFFTDNVVNVVDTENWTSFFNDYPIFGNDLFKKCFKAKLK